MKVAVLGAGSWGTALGLVLAQKEVNVSLWSWQQAQTDEIIKTKKNEKYLPGVELPEYIKATSDLKACIEGAEIVLVAVPSQAVRSTLEKCSDHIKKEQVIVNVSKGIEMTTLKRISEVVEEFLPENKFVALSGPSHAEEVSRKIPTTLVSASTDREAAELIQDAFTTENLRIYTNPDLIGVEVGGALKNIIALGAGISDGLGFGDNAKAALMTRGIHEIARLGLKMGAKLETFSGLSGIGDLIVTCTSMHSRNRRCGIMIGEGMSTDDAIEKVGMVVEGIYTIKSAYGLSEKYGVEMPIAEQLYKVIYEDYNARESVSNLMLRRMKHETEEAAQEAWGDL